MHPLSYKELREDILEPLETEFMAWVFGGQPVLQQPFLCSRSLSSLELQHGRHGLVYKQDRDLLCQNSTLHTRGAVSGANIL